jgi:hypothetical protein
MAGRIISQMITNLFMAILPRNPTSDEMANGR